MPWTHDSDPVTITRGPLIFHLESVFWQLMRYPSRRKAPRRPPLTEAGRVRELEQPYRHGHARIVRFPLLRRGIAVGYWEPPGEPITEDEESAKLAGAINGAMIPGITATEISEWTRAVDWSWLRLAGRWLASFLPAGLREWLLPRIAPRSEAVAQQHDIDDEGFMEGWTLTEWDDSHPIIDLEEARTELAGRHVDMTSSVDFIDGEPTERLGTEW